MSATYPAAIVATLGDLPPAVAAAYESADTTDGTRSTTTAEGIPFSAVAWGDPDDRPLVLIHGVTASAAIWWRVGPALAATSRRVVAVDLPGHGLTGHWQGHHRFQDNALDVAAWVRSAGLDVPDLQIVGHSWGAMTAAALPRSGVRPATLVLLDPPAVTHAFISGTASQPSEFPSPDVATNSARLAAANPDWSPMDVRVKAEALAQVDLMAARDILFENGDWDAGLADLGDPAADGIAIWVIRGDPAAGSYLPDAALPRFAARIGPDHILTLAGAPHSPQRSHPAATVVALLRALD